VKASIQEHFLSEQYSAMDIVAWVEWFCATHGSLVFHETPVPQDSEWDVTSTDYKVDFLIFLVLVCSHIFIKRPHGFLRNKLLVNVATYFLPEIKKTTFYFGPP
jgi:hypothetical protein